MLINGTESTTIAADDRGLAYGDGLFSTIKVERGIVQLWDYHLQRLQLGAKKLFFPEVDWLLLSSELHYLAKTVAEQPFAVIKVMLTRGSGGRGYSIQGCSSPQRILSVHPYPVFYQQWQRDGLKVIQCRQKLAINRQLAGLKTLNRLEQILIKHELEAQDAFEGIVCDNDGHVIEACSANLFLKLKNHWVTPKLDGSGIAGVKRRQIMELSAKAGQPIREMKITINDLLNAQAVCLSNALMGIVPVIQYQSHCYPESSLLHIQKLQSLVEKGEVFNAD
ncbi:aminodeoxychorismate lyase apoprotein [Psychromonas ingrahamii 37]|uniref:Aminodeoxychorismate lyase n=1 Tax=Psychromonas ingrahamii (strain DSM 17664 / CCUG 51855 / 37) TaxID=357804 RepID=A1STW6_PSYIN|nr:aminodeoxychorismate lyase [Psychromonas ingrahamii]ABM02931.1 aminodeoxychorismate lyase apoprotein [Psychromonas ingrahamii 37]